MTEAWSWWAGHQITEGKRKIPILGTIPTRLDTYYLAKIRRRPDGRIQVIRKACRARYAPIAGIDVHFPVEHTPDLHLDYKPKKSQWEAEGSVQWQREDLDQDQQPGLSITVDALICGGKLYIGCKTKVKSQAQWRSKTIWEGRMDLRHAFEVLGASRFCLRAFSRNRGEHNRGRFRFKALPGPTTCAALNKKPWPSSAEKIKPSSSPEPAQNKRKQR